ncbi:hypothetical protein EN784_01230 [bacterium M00.F.Ca.ET.141.01.1.1]|nr:hypothetical protein EN784_01230 [bacterium M00.F.Ca.ET.141.01.1.1]
MTKSRGGVIVLMAIEIVCMPVCSFADGESGINIKVGRADVLLSRASDGLSKLLGSRKNDISDKWSDDLQNRAADICAFVQKELKKAHLDDKDVPLCSVE